MSAYYERAQTACMTRFFYHSYAIFSKALRAPRAGRLRITLALASIIIVFVVLAFWRDMGWLDFRAKYSK